jgi:ADP-heptose:LPS heptosyltransferase
LRLPAGKIIARTRKVQSVAKHLVWLANRSLPNSEIHAARGGGIGDVLMCTPALRALKRANPKRRIHFYTEMPDLVRGLWFIDAVSTVAEQPPLTIAMTYEGGIPPRRHLARIMADRIAIRADDITPDCVVPMGLVEKFKREWAHLPHPHILVQRRAGPWTPNKDWPEEFWEKLIRSLLRTATIVEIGEAVQERVDAGVPRYIDLRGKTTLQELVASVAAADILIAPDSGPIHIAAAVRTPAVVILGGYILPEHTAYPGHRVLHTPMHCSPCWLKSPCPSGRTCLTQISPEAVEQAAMELWSSRSS